MTSAGTASDRRDGGLVPDAIEIETEDGVGVEDEPAPFVVGDRRSQDLAQQRQGDRHVEVVVDGGNEAVVEAPGPRSTGERRARRPGRSIAKPSPSVPWPATPVATPSGRSPARPARSTGGAAHGPSAGGGPSDRSPARSDSSAAAAAAIERSEYSSLRE